VKTKIQSLSFIATLAVVFGMISWGSAFAQSTSTPTDQPNPQTQPAPTPDNPPATQQAPTSQTPDQSQAPSSKDNSAAGASSTAGAASDSQTFSGTVVKSGDKYMLKDDSGKTYDIDHQTDVAKFEGKRVRVQGKLDDTGTKIMVK
jgi:hypothetical protein